MRSTLDRPTHRVVDTAAAGDTPTPPVGGRRLRADLHTMREPWCRRDLIVVVAVALVGVGGVVASWRASADEIAWRNQLAAMSVGAAFAAIFVLAGVLWVILGIRRVRAGFRALRVTRAAVHAEPGEDLVTSVTAAIPPTGGLVTAASMTRVHHPDCLLMRGKTAIAVAPADAESLPLCGVCHG